MAFKTIHLRGDYTREEALAGGTIKPGYLIELYNASGEGKFQAHSTAKGFAEKMFAVEDALQGKTIADSYAAGDLVSANIEDEGAMVLAWLKAGTSYVIGDKLESAGDGTLQKVSGSADLQILGVLLEAHDLTPTGAVATQAPVRIV